MAGRRTNLALLWVSVVALVSGVAAFLVGTPSGTWVVIAHGVVALAIVILIPWKSMIAARGLSRRRPGRFLAIALTAATLLALGTGVVLVTGATDSVGAFTMMQLHISFGLLTVSLALVHTLQRPVPHRTTDFSRRNALRSGGLLAMAASLWLATEGTLDVTGARGGERRFTGSHEIVDPDQVPATQWIDDVVQHLDRRSHVVIIMGAAHSVTDLADPADTLEATLDCTGGWFTTQKWSGTRLDRVVDGQLARVSS